MLESFLSSAIRPIRRLPEVEQKVLYLTFDDGPDPRTTTAVLRILEELNVPATFFLVAKRASAHPGLVREIIGAGHAIGNHSLDHRYRQYFTGWRAVRDWLLRAEELLTALTGEATVGFRPPASVIPPPLTHALADLNWPLLLWDIRFFDASWSWTAERAERSLLRTQPGAIVLLHDRQKERRRRLFLETLVFYIELAKKQGHAFRPLSRSRYVDESE